MKPLLFSIVCCGILIYQTTARSYDDIEREMRNAQSMKILRVMSNQTKDDIPLNLPANASSIRENITDTLSCENRTYGYYADVDNDCQVFHVCLPSKTPSGRNVTYKWSFICPNETIFNQEVLVCTRPIDSIPCEDAPMYYYVNMEFGKTNNTKEESIQNPNAENINSIETNKTMQNNNNQRKKPDRRKQNLVTSNAHNEKLQILNNKDPLSTFASLFKPATYAEPLKPFIIDEIEVTDESIRDHKNSMKVPDLLDAVVENGPLSAEESVEIPMDEVLESARLVAERSKRWQENKARVRINRSRNLRFKADV